MLDAIAAETGTLERLVAAYQVLGPERIAAYDRHLDAANPASDAAIRRSLRIVLHDEVDHVTEGLTLIETVTGAGGVDSVAAARDRFSALLGSAGGLTPERRPAPAGNHPVLESCRTRVGCPVQGTTPRSPTAPPSRTLTGPSESPAEAVENGP